VIPKLFRATGPVIPSAPYLTLPYKKHSSEYRFAQPTKEDNNNTKTTFSNYRVFILQAYQTSGELRRITYRETVWQSPAL
jgi:hypothetical protein